ncbi:sensor histidine kinase [Streptomyces sp. NBC_00572]|uniref:sensor histidine kinase n=1 Tax=Streptomyces sp. NBC_00572 TaxID=2903664 RepID=UPI00225188B3|nr:sensor histidine kinase [Streptomyces sp. NBC_00572]MCX4982516.1 sensor histidine kinase [Streptomyces sp. NBC_00572]
MTSTKTTAWVGGALYLLAVGLLVGGAPRVSGTVHGLGALLAASLLVGVLRRAPLLALSMALFGSTAVVVGPPGSRASLSASYQGQFLSYLAADLVLGVIVATCARRTSMVAVAGSLVVQLLVIGGFSHGDDLTVNVVIALLAMATACTGGRLSRERREHAVALRSKETAEAVIAERLRIARELHDMVAHSIGIIAIQAGAASQVIRTRPAEAGEALRAIEVTSRETLSGLRRTLVALRQADPDATASGNPAALAPSPGLADLDRLAAATADAGVRVEVRRGGEERPLPADIDLSAFRIVQEALTNVVRHAGTGRCRVLIDYGNEELSVEVVDDGHGATENGPAHGFGLVGMRERVALLHGEFSAGTRPEGGFRVTARLPLPASVGVSVEAR